MNREEKTSADYADCADFLRRHRGTEASRHQAEEGRKAGRVIHRLRRLDADYLRGFLRRRERHEEEEYLTQRRRGHGEERGKESHPQITQIGCRLLRGFFNKRRKVGREWLVLFGCVRTSFGSPSPNPSLEGGE